MGYVLGYVVVALFAGLLAVGFGGIGWWRLRVMRRARVVSVAEWGAAEGRVCRVVGVAGGEVLSAPRSGRECVWYRLVTEETWVVPGVERRSLTVGDETSGAGFVVRDSSGAAPVDVREAEGTFLGEPYREEEASPLPAGRRGRDHRVVRTESIVAPGQEVYVLGPAGGAPLVVATVGERAVHRNSRRLVRLGLLVGLPLVLGGLGVLVGVVTLR